MKLLTVPFALRHRFSYNFVNTVSKRNINYITRTSARCLTSNGSTSLFQHNSKDELIKRNGYLNCFGSLPTFSSRNFSVKKPSDANASSAAGDDDDDHLYEDDASGVWQSDDEATEERCAGVPTTSTVPEFFPKVPLIATHYPVFPKFMKVFEVSVIHSNSSM